MKVLFAVGTDQLSKNIADKYYEKYGEVLEYKNVFFFKALIEEVKNNKTYDRIVINEDFEEYRTKDLEQLDRVIFNYIDKITDETQDAEIILICANRRSKGDPFISKLFSIGIYNLLIGDDRNMNPLCEIIKKPKNKREAKQYLNIDTSLITENSITRDNEVDEYQVKSILSFYEGIRNQPEKYLETFDRVAEQYSRVQLKIIVEYLPKVVKDEIFKADRYKYLAPQPENQQVNVANQNSVSKVKEPQKEQTKKKGGLFGGFKKHKPDPAQNIGKIDMSEMQSSGKVDLSSNTEEQKIANVQAEAKMMAEQNRAKEQAELEARARAEAAARAEAEDKAKKQAELEAKAKERAAAAEAEAEARKQEELANKARAEIEARKQAELEAKARAEAEARRRQAELEERARAEAAAREQASLAEKAKAEAIAREQASLAEKAKAEAIAREQASLAEKAKAEAIAREQAALSAKAKAEATAREQAELSAKAKAEAMAREQAMLAAKAKAEVEARTNSGVIHQTAGVNATNVAPNTLVEIKPNPNAPERKEQKNDIPIATVVSKQEPKNDNDIVINNNVNQKPQVKVEPNIQVNPIPQKVAEPKINVTTNSGNVPNRVITHEPVNNIPNANFVPTPSINQPVNNVSSSVVSEQERRMKEEQEKLALEQKKIREAQEKLEEEKRKLREEQEKLVSAQTQLRNEYTKTTPHYTNNEVSVQTAPIPNYKKMIVFVGANKVGTTFVTNAVAHTIASSKVVTSIIDMTRDKSLYYIYADESKALKNRAAECMQRLADGEDYYIETMNSYLKLYTTIAGAVSDQRRGYKHKAIIDTVKANCNLTIVDADFTTPIDYFDQADEIYLIQDLDILKIQDVTLFLRELNARGLDKKKIRLIINKFVKTSITPKIIIGALDFYHDPGGTYVDSGLMPSKVDYSIIPYNLNNYAKYVESLHKMSGNFNYKNYSTDFVQAIDEIVGKVYPKNAMGKPKKFFG